MLRLMLGPRLELRLVLNESAIFRFNEWDNLFSDSDFEPAAQWIIALNTKLTSGTLKDIEIGRCKLELLANFTFPRATLTVSHSCLNEHAKFLHPIFREPSQAGTR